MRKDEEGEQPQEDRGEQQQEDGGQHRAPEHVRELLAGFIAASLGAVSIMLYETGTPPSARRWVLLLLVGLLAGVGGSGLGRLLPKQLDRIQRGLAPLWPQLGRALKWLFSPDHRRIALVIVLVFGLVTGSWFTASAVRSAVRGCEPPFELRVLTSPEELRALQSVANEYEAWVAGEDGCRTVNLTVYAAPWPEVREALVAGWPLRSQTEVGPRPDVWLPQTSLRYEKVRKEADAALKHRRSIARSPVVLGVPSSHVEEVGFRLREGSTWDELRDAVRAAGLGLVRPDPSDSITGKLGTAALYRGKLKRTRRLAAIEQRIADALDRGGYPLRDAKSILCHLRHPGNASPPVATLLSERALVRYNDGDPLGEGCRSREQPKNPLYAFYPEPTYLLDHPFIQVDWLNAPEVEERRQAIDSFEEWLHGPVGEEALKNAGLRPVPTRYPASKPRPGKPWLRAAVKSKGTPTVGHVSDVMAKHEDVRRPVRLLLALDTSGSMDQTVGKGSTHFELAVKGVEDATKLLGPEDEFGLWAFHGNNAPPYEVIVPVGSSPTLEDHSEDTTSIRAKLRNKEVEPGGNTPLFNAIAAGVRRLAEYESSDANTAGAGDGETDPAETLVVLTDGKDTVPDVSPRDLLDLVHAHEVRVFVLTVGTEECTDQALAEVTRKSGVVQCDGTGFAELPDELERVFRLLRGDAPNE